jgi:adenylate cyclase
VTILFADIRRFSAAAEAHTPEEVIGFLNDYFRVTSEAIFRHGGTLDKFMGDGFMALFGAPIAHADDADRAARAAVEIMEHLAKLNREKADSGFCPLVIGIGMNTADVIAGNVGTDRRMEYTVIGDGVNIAARLEKLTKKYEAKILISQAMYDRLSHKASAIPYGEAVLEGRSNPTRIYGIRHVGMDASMTR